MFDLADSWVWDFWVVDDPEAPEPAYHLFFLHAPRSLGDPERRHVHASVGHAVSTDLIGWTRLPDPLPPSPPGGYDDRATWTGSVVRADDGSWQMFTSGISWAEDGRVQRIGRSTSRDLLRWTRDELVLGADPRWYHRPRGTSPDEHWRDPWLVRDDEGGWHMYVTAQVPGERGHGVVGHATSPDLDTWQVRPPLSEPTGRFDQLEVVSLSRIEGRWALLFSCLGAQMPMDGPGAGGVWAVPVDGPGSPVDVSAAVRVTSEDLYVGKVVTRRDGTSCFLAFENGGADGRFRGGVIDPVPVRWDPQGRRLELLDVPQRWRP